MKGHTEVIKQNIDEKLQIVRIGTLIAVFTLCAGLVAPIFPLYAQIKGASLLTVGIFFAVGSLFELIFSLPMGKLAGKVGLKHMFSLSMFSIVLSAILPIIGVNASFAASRIFDGASNGTLWPSVKASANQMDVPKGKALGIMFTVFPAMFFLASSISGAISSWFGYEFTFILAALIGAVGLYGNFRGWFVPRILQSNESDADESHADEGDAKADVINKKGFLVVILTNFLSYLVMALALAFLSILANERGVLLKYVGLSVGMFWLGRALVSLTVGNISDKHGSIRLLLPSVILSTLGTVLVASVESSTFFFIGAFAMGAGVGAAITASTSLMAECVPKKRVGWAMGLTGLIGACGFLITDLTSIFVGESGSANVPFLAVAGINIVIIAVMAFQLGSKSQTKPE